ncbi:hypothetical protein [Sphingobacterium paludis]|uniref:Phospholipase D-like protein n=1 Tax=Sphingobacterium paludis TaxID=1476465 RepID=A0A4V3E1W8_9SPHI|nr:hypothetical protein [Sphingobacterium paludis]TDS14918.1 hypothetical protein B0I21_103419 [Sphingobacterium paludis]
MRNLIQQTRQAFYFSLGFYILAIALKLFQFTFADVLISIALLLSLVWTVLVLREVMLSQNLTNVERLLLIIFIIFGNIIAGIAYFFFIRERVVPGQGSNKS